MLLFATGLAGAALVLFGLGVFEPPQAPLRSPPPGSIAVPVAARALPAYTEVRLEHLIDPATGVLAAAYLPKDSLLPETLVDPGRLLGRVLAYDKPAGRVFSGADFLPEGTRPGLVAGIPSHKRALRIDASKLSGAVGLRAGDRVDLVATRGVGRSAGAGGVAGALAVATRVARDAVVVAPATRRELVTSRTGARVVEEIVIALDPSEVPRVTEALASAARLDCVPHSGRPAEPEERREHAEVDAYGSGFAFVESIEGSERSWLAVPQPPAVSAPPAANGD
jgi:Flp pilus assembly protein CpaB